MCTYWCTNNTPKWWASSVTQSQPFFGAVHTNICDPKGFCSAEGCNVRVRVHSVLLSTLCTLKWDTLRPSAGWDPFGSHIDMDVCVHSPGRKNGCDCVTEEAHRSGVLLSTIMYTRVNKNPSAWNFLSLKPEVTCGTVAIIIRVILLSPYLRIRAISLSSIHYNQSHRIYINRRRQYICLIWN